MVVRGLDLFEEVAILETSVAVFYDGKSVFVWNRDCDFLKDGRKK